MALDHYVSQVHLKQFYSPALGELMYATRKSDLKSFRCNTKSVCRIEEGNTNAYLVHDRAIEEFLQFVEPNYDSCLATVRGGTIDPQCVAVISGFAAYVACCAPAAMRIHSAPLESMLISEATILDRQGLLPPAPAELGNKTLTKLLADGSIHFNVDQKYPQAVGISTILGRVSIWGNSQWEVLRNSDPGSPFFTSDYPIALEARDHRTANWIVPLAPDIAIRIIPDISLSGTNPDLTFPKFKCRYHTLARGQIVVINRLIVRSAEDAVFYRDNAAWVHGFIAKNRHYRIEAVTERIPSGTGFFNLSTQRIVEFHQNAPPNTQNDEPKPPEPPRA